MAKTLNLLLAASTLFTLPFAVQAEEPTPAQPQAQEAPLTLEECVARALQKNFDIKIQGYNTQIANENLTIAKADYVPVFTANAQKGKTSYYGVNSSSSSTTESIGFSQKISTGAIVSLATGLAYQHSQSQLLTPGSLNPAYVGNVTLNLTQPLLSGAGTTANLAAIRRAKLGVGIASLAYKGSVLQVIDNVENAYYNLCFNFDQLGVKKHSLELAQALYNEAVSRRQVGVATDLDVLQAKVGVEQARQGVILAMQSLQDSQDSLFNLIGQFEFTDVLRPVRFPTVSIDVPTFDAAYKLAQENQPNLLASQMTVKQYAIDASTARNARLPSLDLGASLGYNTRESTASRAYNEIGSNGGYDWQVGLTFSMPWGLKAENARYRSALHTLDQSRTQLLQLEQNLMLQVRSAVRAVRANLDSVKVAATATQLSEQQYELERARFAAGLSTAQLVLQSQDNLEQTRMSELQAKVTLRIAVAALQQLEGTSLEHFKVELSR
ncbi:outer membrane channel protein [mine drainage metagenome]|uniref:Outer membrane channel protein n=1 Tax=mine drainage metagenome TaxID=410659 RepID=A0A1J5SJ09_9ZZZZ